MHTDMHAAMPPVVAELLIGFVIIQIAATLVLAVAEMLRTLHHRIPHARAPRRDQRRTQRQAAARTAGVSAIAQEWRDF